MKKTNRSQVRQSGKRVQVFKSEANLGSARLRAIPFALAIAFGSSSSFADPAGAVVAAGQAAISSANGITTIQQMSDRAVVNWQSFNVNAGEAVKFVQPSSTAAILNRVTGGSVSNINGLIEGNGRVYLINPNGIVVGANGVVNVNGGFVASTKSLADSAFMSGGALVFTGESTGSIQILGKVQSAQGDVILIAPKIAIEKTGSLIAGQTIKLVAANEVELSNGKFTVKPKAGDAGQLTVEGALEAAKVQLAANNNNLGALAINTTGTIRATGTQTNPDGSVSIIATGEGGNINISGNIRSEKGDGKGGEVTVLADNNIRVSGTIDANSDANSTDATKKGGDIIIGRDPVTGKLAKANDVSGATLLSNKGFVETSGDWMATRGATVLAKDWLLDPTDIKIVAGDNLLVPNTANVPGSGLFQDTTALAASEVLKSTIESAINNGTNVTISTANAPGTGQGNITIETALSFTNNIQDATLSLLAKNGIIQNGAASITATGSKLVNVVMTAEGLPGGVAIPVGATDANSKGITLNSNITTNGKITLSGTSNAPSGANGVGVNSLGTLSAGGNVLVTGTANGGSTGANTGAITSTGGSVTVIGTSATASGATTGVITATSALGDVTVTGTSSGSARGANTGTINSGGLVKVTGTSNSGSAVLVSGIKGKDIAIVGNSTTGSVLEGSGALEATAGGVSITGTGNNAGWYAITTNGTIKATGDIEINTTSKAKHGMNLNGAIESTGGKVTIYADVLTAGSGTAMNGAATIKASGDIKITGKTNGYYSINGLGAITSTNGNVTVDGLSTGSVGVNLTNNISAVNGHVALTATGGNAEGVIFNNLTGITAKSYNVQGTSATSVGVKFNGTTTFNSSVDSKIEGANLAGGTGVYAAGSTININSGVGKVLVRNQTGAITGGMELRSGTVVNSTGDVTFGRNDQGNNALFLQGLDATATGRKLTFLGSSSTQNGIGFQDYATTRVVDIKGINGAKIVIDGKSTANGYAGVNMKMVAAVTHFVTSSGAGGSIDINGTSTLGRGVGVDIAKITANDGNAINITGTGGGGSDGVYIANAVTANGGGNINIKGNTATNNGSGTAVNINSNAGMGTVVANGVAAVGSTPAILAGTVTIVGDAGTGSGISNSAVITGGTVDMTGTAKGTGSAVYSSGAITSTVAGVSIKGTTSGIGGGTTLQGAVTGKTDVKLEGYSQGTPVSPATGNQGLVIQNVVTSTDGKITVTGETKSTAQRAVAITQLSGATFGSLKTIGTNKTININANTLLIASGTPGSFVDAGNTGTVNIKTTTAGNEILVGGSVSNDVTGSTQKLGIDNTELNRITAGNTVIGNTASSGKITVSAATTTLASTGNLTLQTGGDIEVNAALTVGDNPVTTGTVETSKNLTLKGSSTTASAITQNAAIKAAGLELLGANATHTLTNTGNQVTTLAANSKVVNYVNSAALTLGGVNITTGINATGDVSIATQTSDLTISENVNTTASTATALVLNAGKSSGVGADAGGNILVNPGKTVTVGSGGIAQLMTGSISGSTSAASLASAGHFRYNSDETNTNYTTDLGTGINIIYREKPSVTLKVDDVIKLYNGFAFNGGSISNFYLGSGRNGDSAFAIGGAAKFAGNAQGAINVSSTAYVISATEMIAGKSALGYDVSYESGSLMITYSGVNKAPTPPETYTRIAGDVVNLAPVSFAVGVAPATAAGDEADPNICYAWGQRNGGSVTVHTVLKPSYLGLRNAKTDTQEAMSNSSGSSSHGASPCGHDVATNVAVAKSI